MVGPCSAPCKAKVDVLPCACACLWRHNKEEALLAAQLAICLGDQ